MKKLIILSLSLSLLASCTLPWSKDSDDTLSQNTNGVSSGPCVPAWSTAGTINAQVSTGAISQKNMMASLNYVLHTDSPTGKIVDTSVESVAKCAGLFQSGGTYKPFEFVLGTNQVVPGFEAGVSAMKKGEKMMLVVAPKDGYGELTKTEVVPRNSIAPTFTTTIDKNILSDTITQTVDRSMLGEQGGTGLTVGQTLTGGQDMTAKVTKIDGQKVTLSIENKQNPFFGKKLTIGAVSEKDKIKFTVKELKGTGVVLDIVNQNSPFFGKEFKEGAVATLPNDSGTITIKSFSGDTVMIDAPNTHPLAGKTLYFDVDLIDIK